MGDLRRLIGRTIVVGVRGADPDSPELREDLDRCIEAHVGGVILFDQDLATGSERNIVSAAQLAALTAHLRETLGDDLLIMIDQEGGSVARLRAERGFDQGISAASFALLDEPRQRETASAQAQQLASLGINMNLAPTVDLSLSSASKVIAKLGRSFGADPELVIRSAAIWIEAHQRAGVACCLKHYPGHGSAAGDTHEGIVDITNRTTEELELAPYAALACEPGVAVMTGHMIDRGIDSELPASLSRAHTEGTLRRGQGFDGVVATDSIDMGAIASRWQPGEASVMAISAGADLVIDGVNAPGDVRTNPAMAMSDAIASAIREGRIEEGERRLRESGTRLDRLLDEIRSR